MSSSPPSRSLLAHSFGAAPVPSLSTERGRAPGALAAPSPLSPSPFTARLAYEVLMALDLDRDGRITAKDAERARSSNLRFAVDFLLGPGVRLELSGAERLSHAADVLAEEILQGRGELPGLPATRLLERRTAALRRMIDQGWEGLVRRSDRVEDLEAALRVMPVKSPDGRRRVYVPAADRKALKKLRAQAVRTGLDVVPLAPPKTQADWVRLMREPGMAYLPRPYIVPGGRFVQMFGWDSYFNGRGALASGRPELARDMLENQLYAIEHYGKIANSNLSYHLSRTQPPLMPRLALELHEVRPDRKMLQRVAKMAMKELETVFRTGPRGTPSGLSRFKDDAEGPDAEDLSAFYEDPRPNSAEFHRHDRAIRESGWDMCHRFGAATHHHEPVCLNSLLFQYEQDLAHILRLLEGENSLRAASYEKAARARARTMRSRFWDEAKGMFFDHDFVAGKRSAYESVATFYPLWTGWASRKEAAAVAAAVPRFLQAGGLSATSRPSREAAGGEDLQWDWPFGWAPHQIIAVEGLRRYGFDAEADLVAYRWLSMVLDTAGEHNGLIKEKYDVVRRSVDVAVEYGNQGADRGAYLSPRNGRTLGFAWTNASVLLLLDGLPAQLRELLDVGVPAETLPGPSDVTHRGHEPLRAIG
ncbi:Trehalase [Stigmatella aurantiaca DW4/3-1]|uniref:Trehalase n=1 Tax=Stigmatella aurantiaca (strain DW4/3-1) TaxID=378806 RepID=Q093G9_STIAD|nr:Trehalase [Stigmatella aurantiaca DW4/3-1]EAU66872.1 trehalase [Stigmatella aurantiaca DW4/3-1]